MVDVVLGGNWQRTYSVHLAADPVFGTNKHRPLPKFRIPHVFTSSYLLIGADSNTAKPNWKLAFYLDVLVTVGGIGQAQTQNVFIPLGLSMRKVDLQAEDYRLQIAVPAWYRTLDLEIWQYAGTVETSDSSILELKTELARIESKIDVLGQ